MELNRLVSDRMPVVRLNPKNYFLFGRLFGEEAGKPLLISLLNAVLRRGGKQAITDVTIVDDTRLGRELIEDKEVVLDILCKVDGEEQVNVEMQVRWFARMDYRTFWSSILLNARNSSRLCLTYMIRCIVG
ncbi:PD-(D/E)XK nuclease family transposase [Cohnella soli]|uniref:PD-(D/E)XK nuclease family transposase n=1 Tax=Cohnella soli TaxID=425005 RepID=A0ABW0HYF9_9BACL